MIGVQYGYYNTNGAYPGMTSGQAMQLYMQQAQQLHGLDFSGMSPQAYQRGYMQQMMQSPGVARENLLRQYGLANPPAGWQTMPLSDFLRWARQARQSVGPGTGQNQGPARPQNRPQNDQSSPLQVHAHAYQNSNGETVPVRYVRINRTNDYNSRERYDNPARYSEFDASYGKAQVGKTYTVTVEWEDGRTQTTQVVNNGWACEIW